MKSLFKDQGFKKNRKVQVCGQPTRQEARDPSGSQSQPFWGALLRTPAYFTHTITCSTAKSQAAGTPGLNTQCSSSLGFPMPVPQVRHSHLLQGGWSHCPAPVRIRARLDPRPLIKLSACERTTGGTGRAYTQLTGCIRSCREEG